MPRAIDVGRIFRYILRCWPILLIAIVGSMSVVYIYTNGPIFNIYEAKTTIYCPGSMASDINTGKRIIEINSGIMNSERLAEQVILQLSRKTTASSIKKAVKLSGKVDSAVFFVISLSSEPAIAIEISNAMADAFVMQVSGESGRVAVYEYANTTKMVSDGKKKQRTNRIVIPTVSLFMVIGGIVLYQILFDSVRSVSEAVLYERSNIFGVIVKN